MLKRAIYVVVARESINIKETFGLIKNMSAEKSRNSYVLHPGVLIEAK